MELVPQLLRLEGVQYFLSDRLNQDPVEEHFGKQRSHGGGNTHPSALEYGHNERKIVSKSDMIRMMHGNTRGRIRDDRQIDIRDDRALAKRQRKDEAF